jgi:hypothetical protein
VVGRTCDKGVGSRDRASRNGYFAVVGILVIRTMTEERGAYKGSYAGSISTITSSKALPRFYTSASS